MLTKMLVTVFARLCLLFGFQEVYSLAKGKRNNKTEKQKQNYLDS